MVTQNENTVLDKVDNESNALIENTVLVSVPLVETRYDDHRLTDDDTDPGP